VRKLVLTVNSDSSSVKSTAFAAGLDGVGWFHLVGDVIDPVPGLGARAAYVKQFIRDRLIDHKEYIHTHGGDMPENRDWFWKTAPTRRKS